jgi:hypothetical protein
MKPLFLALSFLLVAAGVAEAVTVFSGRTSQDRSAELRTNDRRLPVQVELVWRAPCNRGVFRETTSFRPPFDSRSATEVRDSGAYTMRDGDLRIRVRGHVRGRRVAPRRWRGTFGATAVVRRDGRVIDRCPSGTITWRASR